MSTHFITYGDQNYTITKRQLCEQAVESKWFETVTNSGPEHLPENFKQQFQNILCKSRIAGYGIWRPLIIKNKLKEIADKDVLIYCDGGMTINTKGKKRLEEYMNMLTEEKPFICFQMGLPEKHYTTKEVFEYFNTSTSSSIANSGQITSCLIIVKKINKAMSLINKWLNCVYNNPVMFTDFFNDKNQEKCFKDHRHEQSVYSVLQKTHNACNFLTDETYHDDGKFDSEMASNYPFHKTRFHDRFMRV